MTAEKKDKIPLECADCNWQDKSRFEIIRCFVLSELSEEEYPNAPCLIVKPPKVSGGKFVGTPGARPKIEGYGSGVKGRVVGK